MAKPPDPNTTRVVGFQLVCPQCPRKPWMLFVPRILRPRSWNVGRKLAGATFSPEAQRAWTPAADNASMALAFAESIDAANAAVIRRHNRFPGARSHTPETDMITERRPAVGATYAAPFEYKPVTRPRSTPPSAGGET